MTLDVFPNIVKQAVIDMPYLPGFQVNTFYFIDGAPDLSSDNLGATYSEYKSGRFWSRDWVSSGSLPDNIKAKYPILFLERGDASFDCLSDPRMVARFNLLIVDKIDCPDCPKSMFRDLDSISQTTLSMMQRLINEIRSYGLYELDTNPVSYEWLSEGRLESLEQNPPYDNARIVEGLFEADGAGNLEMIKWGLTSEHRGWALSIPIEICWPEFPAWNYNDDQVKELATNICPC